MTMPSAPNLLGEQPPDPFFGLGSGGDRFIQLQGEERRCKGDELARTLRQQELVDQQVQRGGALEPLGVGLRERGEGAAVALGSRCFVVGFARWVLGQDHRVPIDRTDLAGDIARDDGLTSVHPLGATQVLGLVAKRADRSEQVLAGFEP